MRVMLIVWTLWYQEFTSDPQMVEVYDAGSPEIPGDTPRALCERTVWALTDPKESNERYFCTKGLPS